MSNIKTKQIFDEKLKVFKEIEYIDILDTEDKPTGFYEIKKETVITDLGTWLDNQENQSKFNEQIISLFYYIGSIANIPYIFLFTDFSGPERTFLFARSITGNTIINHKKTFVPVYDINDIDKDNITNEIIKHSIVVGVEDVIKQLGYVNTSPTLVTQQSENTNIPVPHLEIPIVSKDDSQEFIMYLIPMDEHCYKIDIR